MDKPEISIILPAIRVENWNLVYESISKSTKRRFELIICSPYPLTKELQSKQNVKYVKDFGSPTRASMIASLLAEGNLITWFTDDATMLPEALDEAIDCLYSMGDDYKNVVLTKYLEGRNGTQKINQPDDYYLIRFHPCTRSEYLPNDLWFFNTAIMYRSFFEELGGLDCNFEHAAMADTDLAIRAQTAGAKVLITQTTCYDCDHGQPDHLPVEIAQVHFDEPLLHHKYRDENWRQKISLKIDINNWKNSPNVWSRRFQIEE